MSGDSLLTLTIQILAFLTVAVGIYTTLYPLTQRKHKLACLAIFAAMGLGVVVLTTIQSNQASREQVDLRNQLDRIRADNHQDIANVQARLDAVVAVVKTAPPNANIKTISEKVTKIAAPIQPIRDLKATVE
jgi:hypothetical protein